MKLHNYLTIFIVHVITLVCPSLCAQNELEHDAPTLQLGLDGLSFSKGNLDAALVMEIIAEKQKEVKLKLVQNMFLSKMDSAGGAFYSFADNVIRGVLTERDPEVITKKLLENTLNITFTYAFADYYVKRLTAANGTIRTNFDSLTRMEGLDTILISDNELSLGIRGLIGRSTKSANAEKPKEDSDIDNTYTAFIALMVDMASECIRNNKTLKDLGIMQVSYSQSYEHKNKFLRLKETYLATSRTQHKVLITQYNDMERELAQFTNLIGILYYHIKNNTYRLNSKLVVNTFYAAPLGLLSTTSLMETSIDNLKQSIANLTEKLNQEADTIQKRMLRGDISALTSYYNYLKKADSFISNNPMNASIQENISTYSDIVYTLYHDMIPNINKMTLWDNSLLDLTGDLEVILRIIEQDCINDTASPLNNLWVQQNIESFITILSTAYQFDKATTFSNSVKILTELEGIFPNDRIHDALAFITTFMRDFVAIRKDEKNNEYVDFNVESFILKLSQVKPERNRPVSFLFTVGTGSSFFSKSYTVDSTQSIKNLSFVSEKIGLKIKLIDWSFWMTRSPGESYEICNSKWTKISSPTEPVISDLHLIVYGSGILYNVINTSTSKNFSSPMFGLGLGITFFNTLELNPSLGWLVDGHFYGGFSFDFPFTEYLDRVNQKRQDNKNKKLLSQAN
jgi:hypothetical protein